MHIFMKGIPRRHGKNVERIPKGQPKIVRGSQRIWSKQLENLKTDRLHQGYMFMLLQGSTLHTGIALGKDSQILLFYLREYVKDNERTIGQVNCIRGNMFIRLQAVP